MGKTKDDDEVHALRDEISDAHEYLTQLGIGKPHWSLMGRIELLATGNKMLPTQCAGCGENFTLSDIVIHGRCAAFELYVKDAERKLTQWPKKEMN